MNARRARVGALALALAASGCDLVYPWSKSEPPGTPRGVRASLKSFDAVAVTWSRANGVGAYEVSGRVASGSWRTVGQVSGNTSRVDVALDPSVPDGVALGFRLRAMMGDVWSDWSAEATVTRGLRPAAALTASADAPGLPVRLSWQRGSISATSLVLERRATRSGLEVATWAPLPGVAVSDASYVDSDVGAWTDGARLEYRLRYVLGAAASSDVTATTDAAPPLPPAGLTATATGALGVHLAWTPVSQVATEQVVQRVPHGSGVWADVATLGPAATACDDVVPLEGLYDYRVVARAPGLPDATTPSLVVASATEPFSTATITLPQGVVVDRDAEGTFTLVSDCCATPSVSVPDAGGWTVHTVVPPDQLPASWLSRPYLRAADGTLHLFYVYSDHVGKVSAARDWRDAGGWHTETLPLIPDDTAVDATGALHLVSCASRPFAYATNGSGAWMTELVPHASFFSPDACAIAVGAAGDPRIAYTAFQSTPFGMHVAFLLRDGAGWVEESPLGAAVLPGPEVLRPLAVADGTTLVLDSDSGGMLQLDAYDRTAGGWGAAVRVGTVRGPMSYAVSPDGTRVALGWAQDPGTSNGAGVAVRDGGAWTRTPLAASAQAVGFTAAGKLWAAALVSPGVYVIYDER